MGMNPIGTTPNDELGRRAAFEQQVRSDRHFAAARQFLPPHQQVVPLAAS
jgi:hypothetical protein